MLHLFCSLFVSAFASGVPSPQKFFANFGLNSLDRLVNTPNMLR